jgi:NAD+ kinase
MNGMKVAVFGSRFQSEIRSQVVELFDVFYRYGCSIYLCRQFYNFLSTVMTDPPVVDGLIDGDDFTADFVVSVGGDGTYLRTAHRIGKKAIPILGINTGRLGFLAETECVDLPKVLEGLSHRKYRLDELRLVQLHVNDQPFEQYPCALNEIAVLKGDNSSMINIHATVNGEYLNGYQADGLLIATPTGSTAYALSVGGPIIMPGSRNLLIAAVAPHNLAVRPIIVEDASIVELEIESRSQNFLVALDGVSFPLPCSARLRVSLADYMIKAVKPLEQTFLQTLRKKLYWGIDPRHDPR